MLSSDAFFWSPLDLLAYVASRAPALSINLMSTLRRGIAGDGACFFFFFFFFFFSSFSAAAAPPIR
jgi:hypothetical protein